MRWLRDGRADAIWVYADQAHNYECHEGVEHPWDCDLWKGFGKEYAYI